MPRRPRLHVPGGIYHVILRGNNRQSIFFSPADRLDLEGLVSGAVERYACRVHGYCWMTNHIHLAVQTGNYPVGRFVQWVASQYARRLNGRRDRCGHVFEKRHRAILVDGDRYLLGLIRYIHRNPLEAQLVTTAGAYRWSSHRVYLGRGAREWLTTDLVLSLFSRTMGVARRMLDKYVHDETAEVESGDVFEAGDDSDERFIGDDAFLIRMLDRPETNTRYLDLDDVVEDICGKHDICEAQLKDLTRIRRFAKIRAEIAKLAIDAEVAPLSEVARRFGRSDAVICRSIQRYFPAKTSEPQ